MNGTLKFQLYLLPKRRMYSFRKPTGTTGTETLHELNRSNLDSRVKKPIVTRMGGFDIDRRACFLQIPKVNCRVTCAAIWRAYPCGPFARRARHHPCHLLIPYPMYHLSKIIVAVARIALFR